VALYTILHASYSKLNGILGDSTSVYCRAEKFAHLTVQGVSTEVGIQASENLTSLHFNRLFQSRFDNVLLITSLDSEVNDFRFGRLTGRIWVGHVVKMMMRLPSKSRAGMGRSSFNSQRLQLRT
jgi:hypothetical protein